MTTLHSTHHCVCLEQLQLNNLHINLYPVAYVLYVKFSIKIGIGCSLLSTIISLSRAPADKRFALQLVVLSSDEYLMIVRCYACNTLIAANFTCKCIGITGSGGWRDLLRPKVTKRLGSAKKFLQIFWTKITYCPGPPQ